MKKYIKGYGIPAAFNGSVLTDRDDKREAAEAMIKVARELNIHPNTLAKPSVQGSTEQELIFQQSPLKISTTPYRNKKARDEKMIHDWLVRPSSKYERAALAKRDKEEVVKYVDRTMKKYDNWGSEKVPEKTPKAKPTKLMTYIDRIERNFGNKK